LSSAFYEKGYWIVDLLGSESASHFFERADSAAVEFVDNIPRAEAGVQASKLSGDSCYRDAVEAAESRKNGADLLVYRNGQNAELAHQIIIVVRKFGKVSR
jgi:hypothetical protein